MASLFDVFMFVDWSAASKPKPKRPTRDSVWVGELVVGRTAQTETYHPTRHSAVAHIASSLASHVAAKRRVLLGFDFAYGYPAGLASQLPQADAMRPWERIWSELACRIQDGEDNLNNRFNVASDLNAELGCARVGPFWGRPTKRTYRALNSTSPGFPLAAANGSHLRRLRLAESRLRGIQETWKLYGNGSVGSQALVGIPRVAHLRQSPELSQFSRVWPFETGFTATPSPEVGPFVLHAEIWPGVVESEVVALVGNEPKLIRDQAQVRTMCTWASLHDATGNLGEFFDVPKGLSEAELGACISEEGWVLGA